MRVAVMRMRLQMSIFTIGMMVVSDISPRVRMPVGRWSNGSTKDQNCKQPGGKPSLDSGFRHNRTPKRAIRPRE